MHSYVTPADDAPRGFGALFTFLGRFFGHLCTALAHREAVFGRNFSAIFEHAKATI